MKSETPHVFISYAREDAGAAGRLSETLKVAGIQTWFDQEKLLPGQHWSHEIRTAIKNCDFFIALLSSRSLTKRGFVQREFKQALDVIQELPEFEQFLIPVRLDECHPENETFQGIQWVDLFPQWEVGVNRLILALRLSKRPRVQTSPEGIHEAHHRSPGDQTISLVDQLGLPPSVIKEFLGINQMSRKRYRRDFLVGFLVFTATVASVIAAQTFGFDLDNSESAGGLAATAMGSLAVVTGSYFLISGFSRWRVSYKVRKQVVAYNEVAISYLREGHPWVYRCLFGAWHFKTLFALIRFVVGFVAAILLLLFIVSVYSITQGDIFGAVVLAVSSSSLFGLTWPLIRFVKAWSTSQRMAGVIEN